MKLRKLIFLIFLLKAGILIGQTSIFSNYLHFEYLAIYEDSINHIYITDTIRLTSTKLPWKNQPDKQKTIIWEYKCNLDSITKSKLYSIGWINVDSTGFIENDKRIFIHPPRHNQYSYTEIAPFPQVDYPIEIDKKYKKILYTGTGWGEWTNLKFVNEYEIVKNEIVSLGEKDFNCWFISSISHSNVGQSKLDFKFSPEIGFVEMDYTFYDKKRIKFKLIRYK